MSKHNKLHSTMALLLVLAMMLSMLPMGVFAAEGETVKGEATVVQANGGITLERENNFNKDWKFFLGDNSAAKNQNFNDSGWDSVNLPHDFSIIQEFTTVNAEGESGYLPGGIGWYRKTFVMPTKAEGQSILLNFDGVYMHAYVYVNGQFAGEHHYGYSSFAMDITDYLVCDGATENVIAVKAVNNFPSSRWYSGSGIYRDVTLLVTDPVHVDLNGTKITTPDVQEGGGTVSVAVDVVNDSQEEVTATVKNTVYARAAAPHWPPGRVMSPSPQAPSPPQPEAPRFPTGSCGPWTAPTSTRSPPRSWWADRWWIPTKVSSASAGSPSPPAALP